MDFTFREVVDFRNLTTDKHACRLLVPLRIRAPCAHPSPLPRPTRLPSTISIAHPSTYHAAAAPPSTRGYTSSPRVGCTLGLIRSPSAPNLPTAGLGRSTVEAQRDEPRATPNGETRGDTWESRWPHRALGACINYLRGSEMGLMRRREGSYGIDRSMLGIACVAVAGQMLHREQAAVQSNCSVAI